MEQALRIRHVNFHAREKWVAFAFLALLWLLLHYLKDLTLAAILLISLVSFPLVITNRPLLIFLMAFSVSLAQSSISSITPIFMGVRWIFLGSAVAIGLIHPLLSRDSFVQTWRERKWPWIFCTLALLSTFYSVSPLTTLGRGITILALFISLSRIVKPVASRYGAEKIQNLLLYAALPLYFFSLFLIRNSSAYRTPELTYKSLESYNLYARTFGVSSTGATGRFQGLFQGPNTIGVLTALLFPLALQKLLSDKKKGMALFILICLLVPLILSASREGLFACLVAGAFVLLRNFGTRRLLAGLLPLGVLLLPLLFIAYRSQGVMSYFRLGTNLVLGGGRVEVWLAAIPLFLNKPFWGHGFGTEDQLFGNYLFLLHQGAHAHNSYLGLALQLGLLGAAVLFIPLFVLLYREALTKNPSPIRIGFQGMLVAGLVLSLFESWIYSVGNSQAFPFWCGVATLEVLHDTENSEERS